MMANKESISAEIILLKFEHIRATMDKIEELTRSLPRGLERQFLYKDYASIEFKIQFCEKIIKGIIKK